MSIFARHKIANKIIINKIIKKKTMKRVFGIFIVMSYSTVGGNAKRQQTHAFR